MLYQNLQAFNRTLRAIDGLTLAVGVMLPWSLSLPGDVWAGKDAGDMTLFCLSLVLFFSVISARLGLYHARRTESSWPEINTLFESTLFSLGLAVLTAEIAMEGFAGEAYMAIGLSCSAVLLSTRMLVRVALRRLRRSGRDYRTWLIFGRNDRSAAIIRDVLDNPQYGIRILGVVDAPARESADGEQADPARAFKEPPLSDFKTVEFDQPDALRELLTHHAVDEVVVTLPLRSFYDEVNDVIKLCAKGGVSVKLAAQAFDHVESKTHVVKLGNTDFVTHFSGPSNPVCLAIKRMVDIVLAGVGLILLLPLLVLIAIGIKTTSPGPLFFRQTRVGLGGRLFTVLKFRTMFVHQSETFAELRRHNEVDGPVFKMRNDPRITKVGCWLRKFYLDEFPQLWNVLVGEMSLVGPRPPISEETQQYEWWQRRRLSMQPGLTCLWQVSEDHHSMSFKKWMELDLEYIDRWSLGLDFRLLVSTIGSVLRGKGW